MNRNVVIIGGGGHASSVADVIASCADYSILGYVDNEPSSQVGLSGLKWLGNDSVVQDLIEADSDFVIGVGQLPSADRRIEIAERLLQAGAKLPSFCSSSAVVSSSASIGAGTVLHHGSVVNSGARVGDFCTINSMALIEHGTHIDSYCHIATGAIVNGDCTVGARSFVGSRAVIFQGVAIGDGSVIPAGTVIAHSSSKDIRLEAR